MLSYNVSNVSLLECALLAEMDNVTVLIIPDWMADQSQYSLWLAVLMQASLYRVLYKRGLVNARTPIILNNFHNFNKFPNPQILKSTNSQIPKSPNP